MKVKVGDTIVVVATNKDGSVNGKQFIVAGVLESATGPGGRDGYIHIDDAMEVLRMEAMEISEVAIRLKDFESSMPSAKNWTACSQRNLTNRTSPSLNFTHGKSCHPFTTLPA